MKTRAARKDLDAFDERNEEDESNDLDWRAQGLLEAFRHHGYLQAGTDPLGSERKPASAPLTLQHHGLNTDDWGLRCQTDFGGQWSHLSLGALHNRLQEVYCGPLAIEVDHLRSTAQRGWLLQAFEKRPGALLPSKRIATLRKLVAVEAWESFLEQHFGTQKWFSLEGCDSLITLIDTLISNAGNSAHLLMGMPHRGRTSVLVNALQMPASEMLHHFDSIRREETGYGDLRYHLGYDTLIDTAHGSVRVELLHNPSHLESIGPVLLGTARALQETGNEALRQRVIPVLLHGDAAFAGQGIVAESLNLSRLRSYNVGGTVHVLINNQIGFTTSNPGDARSGMFASDLARGFDIPIIRVNADFPDAVVTAARIALSFRMQFCRDILIDLVGYRRRGHNEQDLPDVTQPSMQCRIARHPRVVQRYADQLVSEGALQANALEDIRAVARSELDVAARSKGARYSGKLLPCKADHHRCTASAHMETAVPRPMLDRLISFLSCAPQGFATHPTVATMVSGWLHAMNASEQVDWRLAETLAYATLLAEGYGIRLAGMDSARGTFGHRHAVWHDQSFDSSAPVYVPLHHISEDQGEFDVIDSPLSEAAALGFEYGYSLKTTRSLVIWEAQYGDFVNNAQVYLDQYVSSGQMKWGYASGLTVFLPHGHEGAGPEHSNGYVLRILHLCAQGNMCVAVPTTAAQWFHLLRRQGMALHKRPLIAFTPKTRLRDTQASYSSIHDLVAGRFCPVLVDPVVRPEMVDTVIVTCGKVTFDIRKRLDMQPNPRIAVIRLEQLYPFPVAELSQALQTFSGLRELRWVQEERLNHGPWYAIRDGLQVCVGNRAELRCVSAPSGASSAAPTEYQQQRELGALLDEALC